MRNPLNALKSAAILSAVIALSMSVYIINCKIDEKVHLLVAAHKLTDIQITNLDARLDQLDAQQTCENNEGRYDLMGVKGYLDTKLVSIGYEPTCQKGDKIYHWDKETESWSITSKLLIK